ncbi:MAG: hypothetical protein ACTSWE_17255, partial [Promethearchaeota archaeon]
EDWDFWLNNINKKLINKLIFSKKSLIREFISDGFLNELEKKRSVHWISKISSLEIILRLIENGWERFW